MKYIEIPCRCGKSNKSFRRNIGEFYIDECCIEAGYDYAGNLVGTPAPAQPEEAPEELRDLADVLKGGLREEVKIPGKGKLKDMRVAELKDLAEAFEIEGCRGMKKKELVEALAALR